MLSSNFKAPGWTMLLPLGMLLTLTVLPACQTPTTGQAGVTDIAITADVCQRAWRPQSFDSKRDTPETVTDARRNNAARAAYCKGAEGTSK